ncbi:MAG: AraC family transcriptional regulator [Anaerotignaceae bacterium]
MKYFFAINLNEDYAWQMNQFHFHDAYELTIVLDGHGEMGVGSHTYTMNRGAVMLLNNAEIHRSKVDDNQIYRRYVIKFPLEYGVQLSTQQTDLLKMFSQHTPCIILENEQLLKVEKLCEKAMTGEHEYGDDLMCQTAFVELLITLNKLAVHAKKAEPYHSKNVDRVTPIMKYIANNAQKNITLDTIATEFYITKQHLCYIFKKTTGLGIGEYLTAQRLIKSCGFLREGKSVQTAGEEAGFRNNSHFIRTFKKVLGVSPGKYSASYKDTIFVQNNFVDDEEEDF